MITSTSGNSDSFVVKYIIPLPLFIAAAFLIYLPVLDHYFVSDDFKVLVRVCLERIIFIKRFFRPLSDLSIYLNYLTGGLNPVWFNSFNILIHGINGYLLYLLCFSFGGTRDKSKTVSFAILSSAFFIFYPFHNEAVVWLLGRGASLACLFALSGLLCYYKIKNNTLKIWATCSCYFISLTAFESTIFFPLIVLLLVFSENQSIQNKRKWAMFLILTLCVHFILRYWLSGSILGSYGNDFFHSGIKIYILNFAKVSGRLILPPSQNAIWLAVLFTLLISTAGYLIFRNYGRIRHTADWKTIGALIVMLCISCIIPVLTGISTQTTESDRFLYFPSVFVCMISAFLIVFLLKNPGLKIIIISLVVSYNLFFLENNNSNWRKASYVTYSILEKTQRERKNGRIFFLNIPNEIEGAYAFRLGFPDALKLYGKDSNRYIAVNYLTRQDLGKMKGKMAVNRQNREIILPPDIVLNLDSSGCRKIYDHGILKTVCRPGDDIYYWDYDKLEYIQGCME